MVVLREDLCRFSSPIPQDRGLAHLRKYEEFKVGACSISDGVGAVPVFESIWPGDGPCGACCGSAKAGRGAIVHYSASHLAQLGPTLRQGLLVCPDSAVLKALAAKEGVELPEAQRVL